MQNQSIDITQIIVAIITAIGVIIATRQRRIQRKSPEQPPPEPEVQPRRITRRISTWTILMGVSLIFLVANLGIFGLRYWEPITGVEITIFEDVATVEITYPYDGAIVEHGEIVRGTSEKIPEGHAIWIVVYHHLLNRYYPQNNSADVQVNGDWASNTSIGFDEDVNANRKFDIIAVLADKRAQDAFNAYLMEAMEKKTQRRGLERLIEGITIYDRITVMRK